MQGQFAESDYESDLEAVRIAARWAPPGSDTESEASGYKKVRPPAPVADANTRKRSTSRPDKMPSPPSKFDANPPQFDGPPRPEFSRPSPEPDPALPASRKASVTGTETTQRVQLEESTRFSKRFVTSAFSSFQILSTFRKILIFFTVEQTTRTVQLYPSEPARGKVVAVRELPPLEPLPFAPDAAQPARRKTQPETPLARPSRFVPAGGARESDYESDYDGAKIRPRWTPAGSDAEHEPAYRKVTPALPAAAGSGRKQSAGGARTPTPPSVFDRPPSFDGPPRPVISPTDSVKIRTALLENVPVQIVRPKAIRPAMPAHPGVFYSQPKPPPLSYAPPPIASVARNSIKFTLCSRALKTAF